MVNEKTKILVVDDKEANLKAMQRVLAQNDLVIMTAQSGNEALAMVLETDFALILLDVQMPEMDGFEVAALLRENDLTKNIPIIFVTALSKEDEYIFKGYEHGAVDYLLKPINAVILKSKVAVFLSLYRQRQELEEKQAELERSNQELTDFAQVISHDLKNPLCTIKTAIEMIQDLSEDKSNEIVNRSLEISSNSLDRMIVMVSELLSFAQLGQSEIHFETLVLNKIIEDIKIDLGSVIKESEADIEVEDLGTLHGNSTLMRQLFQNLLANAIKFRQKNKKPIIKISRKNRENDYFQITVEDNGIGFDEKYLEKIFAVFSRLNRKDEYEGSGVGLATCKKIVERHGGTLTAQSQPGQGSQFLIHFPMI